jgi:TRAP-type C4-dicarboxylate transport system permease small subunit
LNNPGLNPQKRRYFSKEFIEQMKNIQKVGTYIEKISEGLSVALITCMIIVVLAGVVSRYVLISPLPWSEELARYLMIALVYFTVGIVLKRGGHMSITYFREKLPIKIQKLVSIVCYGLILGFSALITWEGFKLSAMLMRQRSPAMDIPMGLVYSVVPIGCVFVCLQSLALLWNEFTGKDK